MAANLPTRALAGGGVFVAGDVTPTVSGATGRCGDIQVGTLEVDENKIFGTWFNSTGNGVIQVVASGTAVNADLSGSWVQSGQATVQHVDHDLRVTFRVNHQDGVCELKMEAKGVFQQAASATAAAANQNIEFVAGEYEPKAKDGTGECWSMNLTDVDAEKDRITG